MATLAKHKRSRPTHSSRMRLGRIRCGVGFAALRGSFTSSLCCAFLFNLLLREAYQSVVPLTHTRLQGECGWCNPTILQPDHRAAPTIDRLIRKNQREPRHPFAGLELPSPRKIGRRDTKNLCGGVAA